MLLTDLAKLIDERRKAGEGFAVITHAERDAMVASMPGGQWLQGVVRADDLADLGSLGLVVVTDQIEHMSPDEARHLLARLRDRHAGYLIVHDPNRVFPTVDYLALGFEVDKLPACYVFDASASSRQREWNNAENWANPENFNRFRW
ncbi:MAG: DUF6231 family protein [Pseudomonadota bacterium]